MRTRVAPTIGVAAETFDSVRMLMDRGGGLAFRRWQVAVRGRLREQALPLAALMPSRGPLVDVVSLAGRSASIDEAVEHLLGAPRDLVRIELENIDFRPAHRSFARNLVDGDREARLQVASALRACHGLTVAPYWAGVRTHLAQARAAYVGSLAEGASTVSSRRSADLLSAGGRRCSRYGIHGTRTCTWGPGSRRRTDLVLLAGDRTPPGAAGPGPAPRPGRPERA